MDLEKNEKKLDHDDQREKVFLKDMSSLIQEIQAMELYSIRKRLLNPHKRQPPTPLSFQEPRRARRHPPLQSMSHLARHQEQARHPPPTPPFQEDVADDQQQGRGQRTAEIDYARLASFLDYDSSFFSPWNYNPNLRDAGGASEPLVPNSAEHSQSAKYTALLDYDNSLFSPWNYNLDLDDPERFFELPVLKLKPKPEQIHR